MSKSKLLSIDLTQACEEITRSTTAGPSAPIRRARSPEEEEPESEEEEEGRRMVVKRRKGMMGMVVQEEQALGLRLSANLLLGVARCVSVRLLIPFSRDPVAHQRLLEHGGHRVYDLQVHSVNVCPLRCALCRQRSAHTDVLKPLPHQNDAVQVFLSLRPGFMDEFRGPTTAGGKKAKKGTSGLDMVDMCVFSLHPSDCLSSAQNVC